MIDSRPNVIDEEERMVEKDRQLGFFFKLGLVEHNHISFVFRHTLKITVLYYEMIILIANLCLRLCLPMDGCLVSRLTIQLKDHLIIERIVAWINSQMFSDTQNPYF